MSANPQVVKPVLTDYKAARILLSLQVEVVRANADAWNAWNAGASAAPLIGNNAAVVHASVKAAAAQLAKLRVATTAKGDWSEIELNQLRTDL